MTASRTILAAAGLMSVSGAAIGGETGWRADAGIEYAAIARQDQNPWRSVFLELGRAGEGAQYRSRLVLSERFGTKDQYIEAGVVRRLADGASLNLSAGAGIQREFHPDWRVSAYLTRPAVRNENRPGGLDLELGAQVSDYGDGAILKLSPGSVHYFANHDAWVYGGLIAVRDNSGAWDAGFAARYDRALGVDYRIRFAVSDAPETENGVTRRSRTAKAGLTHQLDPNSNISAYYGAVSRERGALRHTFGLTWSRRF